MKTRSDLYDSATGSIGSLTAKPSAGGTVITTRKRTNYTQSATSKRLKDAIAQAPKLYAAFSPAIKQSWDEAAASRIKTDKNGREYYWSGLLAFTDCHVKHRLYLGISTSYLRNPNNSRGYGTGRVWAITNNPLNKTISVTDTTFGNYNAFFATSKELSPTITKIRGGWHNHQDLHERNSNPAVIYNYKNYGKKIFIKIISHNNNSRIDPTQIYEIIT